MNIINFAQPTIGGLAVIIQWIIGIFSSIAAGVILFTVLLKVITLPFDIFSKISMRKNSLKMEQMRPELEKLQKQYANDKALYSQKMMALYKKNGYSMFGACLPTIITLVIFIVAISAFNSYSKFQNRQYFYDMSVSYNQVIYDGLRTDDTYIVYDSEKHVIVFNNDKLTTDGTVVGDHREITVGSGTGAYKIYVSDITATGYEVYTAGGYIRCRVVKTQAGDTYNYTAIHENLAAAAGDANYAKASNNNLKLDDAVFSGATDEEAADFLSNIGSEKSAETYRAQGKSFLWVKNIWEKDSPLAHPVQENWNKFKQEQGYTEEATVGMDQAAYEKLILKLDYEKSAPNGFFILCVLTAASAFLMQFITTKSQKAQMELQTVDGQGARTQKIMMWVMPIMMAFFSFLYTAAFSVYMVISSVFSVLSTLGINYLVDKKFKKQNNTEGLVYTCRNAGAAGCTFCIVNNW